MTDLTRRSLRWAEDAKQAGVDAAVTIAARTPKIAASVLDPTGDNARETRLMVSEKVDAAVEGATAAQAALGDLWLRAAFGRVMSPEQWSQGWMDVADAAFTPARLRVRANAERLAGFGFEPAQAPPAHAAPADPEPVRVAPLPAAETPAEHALSAALTLKNARDYLVARVRSIWDGVDAAAGRIA